ncbi:hypothetical protein [Glutamicibacter creatinolyticus]|uniref:hypothetical protein n=1 Tax=Glutamicibacter creatinolyticus TaxID=162496 RepID=UPI0037C0BD07
MKNEILGTLIPRAKRRGIYAVTALFSVALLATACTGPSQAEAEAAHETDVTQDLVKEDRTPENKELPEDLAPLEISIPEAGELGEPKEEARKAEAVVNAVVDVTEQIAGRADGQSEGLEELTEGFVKGQLEAMAAERWQMGVKQTGNAKIVSVSSENIDLEAEPPTMDLHVCLDLSEIDVVDENGNSFEGLLYKPDEPVLNIYGAVFTDGQWKISTHSIPEDSACNDASSKES